MCMGGSNIYPLPGYWRDSNMTDNFISCFNYDACLGGLYNNQTSATGFCFEGYIGTVCGVCDIGYSSTGAYECSKCPPQNKNIVRIVGMLLLMLMAVSIMVRSTLNSALEKKNFMSVYWRILMNHF